MPWLYPRYLVVISYWIQPEFINKHYHDVIMSAMAFQFTSYTFVYSTVYSSWDQRKHQISASLAFVRGIHRWPVNSPHKGPVTRKMFQFDDVIMDRTSHAGSSPCTMITMLTGSHKCQLWPCGGQNLNDLTVSGLAVTKAPFPVVEINDSTKLHVKFF